MRQLISNAEAKRARSQHTKPCSDCPFARTALPGWLGSMTREEWVHALHSDCRIECHALLGAHCAGAAIYRANVCKRIVDPEGLTLPPDDDLCFSQPKEFLDHHSRGPNGQKRST